VSFYIRQTDLSKLSGRTKQVINRYRNEGIIPHEKNDKGVAVYDMDDLKVRAIIAKPPDNAKEAQLIAISEFQREFVRKRNAGELACALTGEFDLMGDIVDIGADVVSGYDADYLDTRKKEKDIEYREEQIKKLKLTHEAMKGGLIEREYASSWVDRYLGTLHQQHLELSTTGLADDLYSAAHRIPDSRAAIKEMEKIVADACSKILKGAIAAMEKSPL